MPEHPSTDTDTHVDTDTDTAPRIVKWARQTGKEWLWHRATNSEGTEFACQVSIPGAPLVLLDRDPDPAEALRCPHCAQAWAAVENLVTFGQAEEAEAPPNVIPMPRQEPEDPAAEMQREHVKVQIENMTRTKVHLTVELLKVEACLVALRGLL